jgi:hypothetical protein
MKQKSTMKKYAVRKEKDMPVAKGHKEYGSKDKKPLSKVAKRGPGRDKL